MSAPRAVAVAHARPTPSPRENVRLGKRTDMEEERANSLARSVTVAPEPPAPPLTSPPPPGSSPLPIGGGEPLPASERGYFEPRMGQALGQVRVHRDRTACLAARSIGADAFALNNHIVLGHPRADRALLAHELAHVTAGERGVIRRKDLSGEAKFRHFTPKEINDLQPDELTRLYAFMNSVAYAGGLNEPGFAANYNIVRAAVEARAKTKAEAQKPSERKAAPLPGVTDQSGPSMLVNAVDAIARMKQIASGDEATGGWFELQWLGKTYRISGANAEALRKSVGHKVQEGLASALRIASNAKGLYEKQSETDRKHWIVAPIIHFIGEIKDPGPVMTGLANSAEATVAKARSAVAQGDFATAARLLVTAESNARQADLMARTYWEDIIFTGETTVKALEIVQDVSFGILAVTAIVVSGGAALGVGGFSAATVSGVGAVATLAPLAASISEGIAKAAMGDKVDWGALAIDAAITALVYRFLGPLSKGIGAGLTKRLVAEAGRTIAKETIIKAVVSVLLGRLSSVLHLGIKAIYENNKDAAADKRPVTWGDFFNQVIAMMLEPKQGLYDLVAISLGIRQAAKAGPALVEQPPAASPKPLPNTPEKSPTVAAAKPPVIAEAPKPETPKPETPKPETPKPVPKPAAEKPAPVAKAETKSVPEVKPVTATKPAAKVETEPQPALTVEKPPTPKPAAEPDANTPPAKSPPAPPSEETHEGSLPKKTHTPEEQAALDARVQKLREIGLAERQRLEKLPTPELIAEANTNLKKIADAKKAGTLNAGDLSAAERTIKIMRERQQAKPDPVLKKAIEQATVSYTSSAHKDSYVTVVDAPDTLSGGALIPGQKPMSPEELFNVAVAQRGFEHSVPMGKDGAIMKQTQERIDTLKAIKNPTKKEKQELGRLERAVAISVPGPGGPAGYGFNTYAVIQVIGRDGKLIAWSSGKYVGSKHAEQIAIENLKQSLTGKDAVGASIMVVGDKRVCGPICSVDLQDFAITLGAVSVDAFVYKRPAASGQGLASEKSTAVTATKASIHEKLQADTNAPTPLIPEKPKRIYP